MSSSLDGVRAGLRGAELVVVPLLSGTVVIFLVSYLKSCISVAVLLPLLVTDVNPQVT